MFEEIYDCFENVLCILLQQLLEKFLILYRNCRSDNKYIMV